MTTDISQSDVPDKHDCDVIRCTMAPQITSLTIVYSTVYSRRRSQKTSKLRVAGLCVRWPVNSPHKWRVTRKMFPFDNVIMGWVNAVSRTQWQFCCSAYGTFDKTFSVNNNNTNHISFRYCMDAFIIIYRSTQNINEKHHTHKKSSVNQFIWMGCA